MTNEQRVSRGYVFKVHIDGGSQDFEAYVRRSVIQNEELDDLFIAVDEGGEMLTIQGWNCIVTYDYDEHA